MDLNYEIFVGWSLLSGLLSTQKSTKPHHQATSLAVSLSNFFVITAHLIVPFTFFPVNL